MKKRTVFQQIMFSYLLMTIVFISLFYCLFYLYNFYKTSSNMAALTQTKLSRISNDYNMLHISMLDSATYLHSNQDLRIILANSNKTNTYNSLNSDILSAYLPNIKVSYSLSVYNINKKISSMEPKKVAKSSTINFWHKYFLENEQSTYLIMSDDEYITYVFPFHNFIEDSIIGFIVYDLEFEDIVNLLGVNNIEYDYFITTTENKLIWSSNKSTSFISYLNTILDTNHKIYEPKVFRTDDYYIHMYASTNYPIVSGSLIPTSIYINEFNKYNTFIIISFFAIIAIVFWVSYKTSLKISMPLNNLIATINSAQSGNLKTMTLPPSSLKELDYLGTSYIYLINKVDTLVEKDYKNKILRTEAQLHTIQQNINPHFLFNTLEHISSHSILENAKTTSKMIQKLGKLLRYSLKGEDLTTVKKELEQTETYLDLQKLSYGENLTIDFKIDTSNLSSKIPKLTLQPIIENSFQHGFKNEKHPHITIKCHLDSNFVYIKVADNGMGMSEEHMKILNQSFSLDAANIIDFIKRKNHIGLWNVYNRLHLLYKRSDVMSIHSIEPHGLEVVIKLPISSN